MIFGNWILLDSLLGDKAKLDYTAKYA